MTKKLKYKDTHYVWVVKNNVFVKIEFKNILHEFWYYLKKAFLG